MGKVTGVLLIVIGVAIGALGRLTASRYGQDSAVAKMVIWVLCMVVGVGVAALGVSQVA
ncbi:MULTISPECIES: hypothetical protein [unclassified Streptomyces]|uniref:hypothetical protein n=1 Tax=unclassified Streptomyces TaxID=2593676 RepID=UPI000A550E73|nr:hypothetical protein [Streptomyces sp. NBC_00370]